MDAGMTEPKTSHAGCSCTRVTAAVRPCLVLEAGWPSAKGLLSLLEKQQGSRHKNQAAMEEGLQAFSPASTGAVTPRSSDPGMDSISQHPPKLSGLGKFQIPHTYL